MTLSADNYQPMYLQNFNWLLNVSESWTRNSSVSAVKWWQSVKRGEQAFPGRQPCPLRGLSCQGQCIQPSTIMQFRRNVYDYCKSHNVSGPFIGEISEVRPFSLTLSLV